VWGGVKPEELAKDKGKIVKTTQEGRDSNLQEWLQQEKNKKKKSR
jgi:hypothetical protein